MAIYESPTPPVRPTMGAMTDQERLDEAVAAFRAKWIMDRRMELWDAERIAKVRPQRHRRWTHDAKFWRRVFKDAHVSAARYE